MNTFNGNEIKQNNYFWAWENNEWNSYNFVYSTLNETTGVMTLSMTGQLPFREGSKFPISLEADQPKETNPENCNGAKVISKAGNILELRIKIK